MPVLQSDPEMRTLYRWYESWTALMKLDIMFAIILILMGFFYYASTLETVLNVVYLMIAFIWAFSGKIGIRLEHKGFTIFFFIFSVVEPIDLIVLMVTFSNGDQAYSTLPFTQIYFAAALALLVRILLMVCTIRLVSSFGHGLRDKVFDPEEEQEPAMNQIIEDEIKPYVTLTIKKLSPGNLNALKEGLKEQKELAEKKKKQEEKQQKQTVEEPKEPDIEKEGPLTVEKYEDSDSQ